MTSAARERNPKGVVNRVIVPTNLYVRLGPLNFVLICLLGYESRSIDPIKRRALRTAVLQCL